MPKFRNVSPLGALDIPALGIIVQAGEVFDVPAALRANFAGQSENYHRLSKAELEELKKSEGYVPGDDDQEPDEGDDEQPDEGEKEADR